MAGQNDFVHSAEGFLQEPSIYGIGGINYTDGPPHEMLKGQLTRRGFGLKTLTKAEKRATSTPAPRSAVQILHEKYPIVRNLIEMESVPSSTTTGVSFKCSCTLMGQTFVAPCCPV